MVAVLVKTFLLQAFFIPSGSMRDTLEIDDRVLVNKLSYRGGGPSRGDVVVFDRGPDREESIPASIVRNIAESIGLRTPEADLIKRVIGLPGETIEIRANTVFIDGGALDEPYTRNRRMANMAPTVIPAEHYFVMGDNRGQSSDSRVFGPISRDQVIGRAFVIIWPPSRWGGL